MEPFQLNAENSQSSSSLLTLGSWSAWDGVTAGFTTRHAGNTALHVGDDPRTVLGNRKKVLDELDWDYLTFTCAEQVHGREVHMVRREEAGRGHDDRRSAIQNTDALITNEPDILLAMYYADCVPLYFYDPVTGSMGLAHAGWKGSVAGIAIHTIEALQTAYGARPEHIRAAIGPSIDNCCYEVDETVLSHVRLIIESLRVGDPTIEVTDVIKPTSKEGHARLDLKHLNRHLMIKAGILPSHIEISSWCTGCRTDLLFSHRKENGVAGRMMSWLGRKSR